VSSIVSQLPRLERVRYALRAQQHEFAIVKDTFIVGRGGGSDLLIDDESVSRQHAVFRMLRRGPVVQDLESRNGTFINGAPAIGSVQLSVGDRIALGSYVLELIVARSRDDASLPPEPITRPMSSDLAGATVASLAALSARERDVFPLLASGLSQREIAEQLGVSVKTIETYRMRIRNKLGLTTRAALVRFAVQAGLLRPRDRN
jgi:RNA polymerase sigma factor (sigma-70 family)